MVNCNPETVSTDYDTSSRLYFEPLTLEDVLEVVHAESLAGPIAGVIVQLGGQTPLGLAQGAQGRGRADRRHLARGHRPRRGPRRVRPGAARGQPAGAQARHRLQRGRGGRDRRARSATRCWCGPRTCSVGAAWRSSTTTRPWRGYVERRRRIASPDHPVLVDRFLDDAIEIDVDALYDGTEHVPRRDHGAHRGGRHPLRRLLVHAAAGHARRAASSSGCASRPSSSPRASACAA